MIKIGQRWTSHDGVTLTITSVKPEISVASDNGEKVDIKNLHNLVYENYVRAFEASLEANKFKLEPDIVSGSRLDDID